MMTDTTTTTTTNTNTTAAGASAGRASPIDTRGARQRLQRERRADPSLDTYLTAIAGYPLLEREEERALGETLRAGRVPIGPMTPAAHAARERLICSHLRLVASIAACYTDQGVPLWDIISAGTIGLIRAVDRYDPGRARFGTHAMWWIAEACGKAVIHDSAAIHIPRYLATNMRRLSRAARRLETSGTIFPAADLLAHETAMTPAQVMAARRAQAMTVLSLDSPLTTRATFAGHPVGQDGQDGQDGSEPAATLGALIADDRATPVDTQAAVAVDTADLYRKLATVLPPRERVVLALRYGLGSLGGVTLTYTAIGQRLDITADAVRALEVRALHKLRTAYEQDRDPQAIAQLALLWGAHAG
jgi:RNA polymerase primary sigma factor